ncbi:MAG TPA: bifunctional phosphoglucose/phosphomannose isomerase [Magnetospirillaceae bacterium]|nr:bifunctional phosphoglucose/phosphomannose isomerase [Magnetospirillaceae bacterium]
MLDDLNVIKQRDPQDYLGFAAAQPEQLNYDFGLAEKSFALPVENVVFTGMGGSSLVAELARTWPQLRVPYVVNKDYGLPRFAGKNTLVIAASYSGNTEETRESLQHARTAGAQIVVITHGGVMLDDAKQHGDMLAQIPECPQPRAGVFYMYRALVEIFVAAKLVPQTVIAEMEKLVAPLQAATEQWVASAPEKENFAKQLAQHMAGKTPIMYAGPQMFPAAYKWKIDVNENAKNTAWATPLPEFNHNEFIGWSSHPVQKPFAVIDLLSRYEHPRIQKRFEVGDRLLSGMRPAAVNVEAKGASVLEHILYTVLLGDMATTYLGLLNNVNPTPVALVEKFKKELG